MILKKLNDETDCLSNRAVPRVASRHASVLAILRNGTQPLYRPLSGPLCREQFI